MSVTLVALCERPRSTWDAEITLTREAAQQLPSKLVCGLLDDDEDATRLELHITRRQLRWLTQSKDYGITSKLMEQAPWEIYFGALYLDVPDLATSTLTGRLVCRVFERRKIRTTDESFCRRVWFRQEWRQMILKKHVSILHYNYDAHLRDVGRLVIHHNTPPVIRYGLLRQRDPLQQLLPGFHLQTKVRPELPGRITESQETLQTQAASCNLRIVQHLGGGDEVLISRRVDHEDILRQLSVDGRWDRLPYTYNNFWSTERKAEFEQCVVRYQAAVREHQQATQELQDHVEALNSGDNAFRVGIMGIVEQLQLKIRAHLALQRGYENAYGHVVLARYHHYNEVLRALQPLVSDSDTHPRHEVRTRPPTPDFGTLLKAFETATQRLTLGKEPAEAWATGCTLDLDQLLLSPECSTLPLETCIKHLHVKANGACWNEHLFGVPRFFLQFEGRNDVCTRAELVQLHREVRYIHEHWSTSSPELKLHGMQDAAQLFWPCLRVVKYPRGIALLECVTDGVMIPLLATSKLGLNTEEVYHNQCLQNLRMRLYPDVRLLVRALLDAPDTTRTLLGLEAPPLATQKRRPSNSSSSSSSSSSSGSSGKRLKVT